MAKAKKSEARVYRPKSPLTPGQAVRVFRELQEMTQGELAAASGLTQPTISSIEGGRANLGIERAKRLAVALKVHPAVLAFSDWQAAQVST